MTFDEAKRDMCRNCVARISILQLKGKARENEAMAFCAGYATALDSMGGPDLSAFVRMIVSFRGFREIEKVAAQ